MQAAVHDAVQAYDKTFEPYAVEILGATGSPAAAVAKATRDILVNRFPAQAATVDAAYTNYFAANGLATTDEGVSVGAAAASAYFWADNFPAQINRALRNLAAR